MKQPRQKYLTINMHKWVCQSLYDRLTTVVTGRSVVRRLRRNISLVKSRYYSVFAAILWWNKAVLSENKVGW